MGTGKKLEKNMKLKITIKKTKCSLQLRLSDKKLQNFTIFIKHHTPIPEVYVQKHWGKKLFITISNN